MLKTLRVSSLLQAGLGNEALTPVTFEDLVEGAEREALLVAVHEGGAAEGLVHLVEKLSACEEGDVAVDAATSLPPELPADPDALTAVVDAPEQLRHGDSAKRVAAVREVLRMNSIEAENVLRDAFGRLERQPFYDRVKGQRLKAYWDNDLLHEPFLEAMTFKQLIEMKLANLLEKRSFADWKITAILRAFKQCVIEHGGVWEERAGERSAPLPVETALPAGATASARMIPVWREDEPLKTLIAESITAQFELQWNAVHDSSGEIARAIRSLPGVLSKRQYVLWWLRGAYELEQLQALLALDPALIDSIDSSARHTACGLLQTAAPQLWAHWQAALAGPGVSEEALCAPYRLEQVDEAFQRTWMRALLRSVGAAVPSAYGSMLAGYWTKNGSMLQLLLDTILQQLPLSQAALEEKLAALLPLIGAAELQRLIEVPARWCNEAQRWEPRTQAD